jgi:hypothetical protein
MADPHASLPERLDVLVESGHFETWPQLAAQLAYEGYPAPAIARIGRDRAQRRELAARLLEIAKEIENGVDPKRSPKRMSPSLRMDALARRR